MDGHRSIDGRSERTGPTAANDAAFDREIESILAVEPSPEFLARVRARVAEEPVAVSWRLPWRVGLVAAAVGAIAVIVVWPYRDRQQQSPAPLTPVIERETPLVAAAPAASQVTPVEELRQPRRHPAPRPTKPASAEELVPVVAQEDARAFEALLAALRDRNVRLVFDDESTESALAASTLAIPPITIEPLPIDLEGGVE